MDRNQRSRRQKKGTPPHKNKGGSAGRKPNRPAQRQPAPAAGRRAGEPAPRKNGSQKRRRPQQNPQKPGYRPAAPQAQRRVTRAEQLRIRRRKAIIGMLCVLAALAVGIVLSVNLLFKVTDYRLETPEHTTPADTGIYTEQQIIDALGVQVGDNLYGFSLAEKSKQLLAQLPYLDTAAVSRQPPGTVIIRVEPAVERFKMQYGNTWLVLSEQLKVLRIESEEPDSLVLLEAELASGASTAPGAYLTLQTQNALVTPSPAASADEATAETAEVQATANEVLAELLQQLDTYGLLDGVTVLDVKDVSELNFLYQGRVSVQVGTANNLDYKIRFAAYIILDEGGDGLTSSDRGTLDVSDQQSDGTIQPRFLPDETPVATPEPTVTPAPENDQEEAPVEGPAE